MRRKTIPAACLGLASLLFAPRLANAAADDQPPVIRCIDAAASAYRLPPSMLVILLSVEGGSLGRVSHNTNGTVDIGPMQVNQIWLPAIARHWHAAEPESLAALRDNFCANVEAGAWILRQAMDQAHGNFWDGVGYYHSHDPGYKADYLRIVLRHALRLQDKAQRSLAARPSLTDHRS
jgi:hypothetical protein